MKEWLVAATALAFDTGAGAGAGAETGAGSTAVALVDGRPASAIFDRRRTTPSHSLSCIFRCADISVAAVSCEPRFSLTSRTVCLRPPIARSAISVAVMSSAMVALSELSSALSRFSRLFNNMQ